MRLSEFVASLWVHSLDVPYVADVSDTPSPPNVPGQSNRSA
jgi:hypothetical protein